jgi:L-ascorbate metabolism protein UlaG (beta-lactamase superfamily)
MKITRRRMIGGGAVVAAATLGGLEYESFKGAFDHRNRKLPTYEAGMRWGESIAALAKTKEPALVHVAHSTHLLWFAGTRFLTDPWFFDPAFGALRHEVPTPVEPEGLGALDAILLTHDHADHADLRAMDRMDKRAIVVAATIELASKVRALGFSDVSVLAPWEKRRIGGATVTAVPGLHDVYEVGYVLRGGDRSVYFAGDTRLHPDLPAIAERLTPDVAILPVDGTRLTGGNLHVMTPADAAVAAKILKVKTVIPSHAEAEFSDPIAEHILASTVARARFVFAEEAARSLGGVRCVVPQAGELVSL